MIQIRTSSTIRGLPAFQFVLPRRQGTESSAALSNAMSDFNVWYRNVQQQRGGNLIDTPPMTAPNDNIGSRWFSIYLEIL